MDNWYDPIPDYPEDGRGDEAEQYYNALVEVYKFNLGADGDFPEKVLEQIIEHVHAVEEDLIENPPPKLPNHCPTCRCITDESVL